MTRLLCLLSLRVWVSAAGAVPVTVNFAAQSAGGAVGDPAGGELAVGARVWVGRFDLTPDEVRAAGRDHFVLAEHFEIFGSTEVGTFGGTAQGLTGAFSGSTTVESGEFAGERLYLWILDAPTLATATSHLVLSDPSWVVPSFGNVDCGISALDSDNEDAVWVAGRDPAAVSPTLGGAVNRARPLDHPDGSDRDGDGRSALIEWATGSEPGEPDRLPFRVLPGTLSLDRRVTDDPRPTAFSAGPFGYALETSADLSSWEVMEAAEVQSFSTAPHQEKSGVETVTLVFPALEIGRRFWRLSIARRPLEDAG